MQYYKRAVDLSGITIRYFLKKSEEKTTKNERLLRKCYKNSIKLLKIVKNVLE